jgi:hypothetical protein
MSGVTPSAQATKPDVGGLQWPAGLSVAVLGPVIALLLAGVFFCNHPSRRWASRKAAWCWS